MINRSEVRTLAIEWSQSGMSCDQHGNEVFGKPPNYPPLGWLHYIFAPLDKSEVQSLYEALECNDKFASINQLYEFNGIDLFSESLFLFGIRTDYTRNVTVWQPFDIVRANNEAKHFGLPHKSIVFGGCSYDNGYLFYETTDQFITVAEKRNLAKIIKRWPSYDNFFRSETERLRGLFDDNGHCIDEAKIGDFDFKPHRR